MNPFKNEWEGEIFTAGNAAVGTFKSMFFNADEGWHVPRIIYNQMAERQCQVFVTRKDDRGRSIREGKLIKEFAIEALDPLTIDELAELARRSCHGPVDRLNPDDGYSPNPVQLTEGSLSGDGVFDVLM